MRKIILVMAATFGLAADLSAQNGFNNGENKTIEVFDHNGRPFVNPSTDVTGSPFYKDDWLDATITLANKGESFGHVRVRVNLQSQEIHFLAQNDTEMVMPPGLVREVVLIDLSKDVGKEIIFRCGFPAIDNRNTTDFYRVLSHSRIWLLQSMKKRISVRKDDLSGEVKREFVLYEDYYIFSKGRMERLKKDRSQIVEEMSDKKDLIANYIKDNKLKLSSIDDCKKLIDRYNEIP